MKVKIRVANLESYPALNRKSGLNTRQKRILIKRKAKLRQTWLPKERVTGDVEIHFHLHCYKVRDIKEKYFEKL